VVEGDAPPRAREPRYTRDDLTLANAFTTLRILLTPIFAWLWRTGDNDRALRVFLAAAATDLIDGFLARWLNQKSRLGALLDPIADKLLMLVALLVGLSLGEIPVWLAAVIICRDALLLVGVLLFATRWQDRHGPAHWIPTRIGKYAMFCQSMTLLLVIVNSTTSVGIRAVVEAAMMVTALLTIVAGGQYIFRASVALAE
jgi:cardiolipin synthase